MANEYVITIRTVLDSSAGVGSAAAGSSPFAGIERSAEQSARKAEKSFAGTGPRIYQSLEAGRQQWVVDQVKAAEQAAKGTVDAFIKAGSARVENEKKIARELERAAKPIIGGPARTDPNERGSFLNGVQILGTGTSARKEEQRAIKDLETAGAASYARLGTAAETSAKKATTATRSALHDVETATAASVGTQTSIWSKLFTSNTMLVRQMGRQVGGQYGAMAANAASLGISYNKLSNAAERNSKVIFDSGLILTATTGKAKDIEKAYTAFTTNLGKAAAGGGKANTALRASFNELGIDAKRALKNPEDAFVGFLTHLQMTTNAETRLMQATGILGASNAKLIPTLEAATVGFAEEEAAAGGLLGMSAGLTIATGGLIAVILAAVIAVGALAVIGTKGVETWASYGEQVYKVEKQTGLSARTIGTLKVISGETGTSMDKLSMATARLEVNISKGVSKPASEAGQALKLLHLNTQEFVNAKPDEKLVMLSKAWSGVSSQTTRARAEAALAGRGYYQLASAIDEIGTRFEKAQKKADQFGLTMSEGDVQAAHDFKVEIADLGMQIEGFLLGVGRQLGPTIIGGLNDISSALTTNQSAWMGWGDFIGQRISLVVNDLRWLAAEAAGAAVDVALGSSNVRTAAGDAKIAQIKKEQNDIEFNRLFVQPKQDRENTGDFPTKAGGKKHKGEQTELQRLQKELRKTTDEIKALHDVGSKEFDLKFKVEDATRFKRDLEDILKLRYELGIDTRAALVEYGATDEQHRQAIETAEAEQRSLTRLKSISDDVRKASTAQADADAHLAALRVEKTLPALSAATLAETKYLETKIANAKAERELLAEVSASERIFAESQEDAAKRGQKAYLELRRDAVKELDDLQQSIDKNTMLSKALRGETIDIEAKVLTELDLTGKATTPTAMDQIAQRAASLDINVAAIAFSVTGKAAATGATPSAAASNQQGEEVGDDAVIKTKGRGFRDLGALYRQTFDKRIAADRAEQNATTAKQIIYQEAQLTDQLVHFDEDVAQARRANSVSRALNEVAQARDIKLAEMDLADIETGNDDALRRLHLNSDQARLNSRLQLKQELVDLEEAIAHSGEDSADRVRRSYLTALHDIQDADIQARESIVRSQVIIADQSVFHSDRARASILDHMAQMRGETEIFATGFVKMIDAAGAGIDSVLGKVTARLGVFGQILSGILSDLLKLTLNKVFRGLMTSILGPEPGQTQTGGSVFSGAQGATGIFSLLSGGGGSNAAGGVNLVGALQSAVSSRVKDFFGGGGSAPAMGNLAPQTSASGQQSLLRTIFGGGAGPATAAGTQAASFSKLMAATAPMLGLTLGAGIGASFGGQSRLGSILGAVGGGAAGLMGGLVASNLLGGTALSTVAATLGISMGVLTAATFGIGGALLVGALILSKNAQRRKEETLRAEWANQALPQVMALLTKAQAGEVTSADAATQFEAIHSAYMANVNTLKDSKTRRIATAWWDNDVAGFYWPKIRDAAKAGDNAKEFEKKWVPTYAIGGAGTRGANLPGIYNNVGERLSWVDPRETVLTAEHVARLGGAGAMAAAGVPGYTAAASAAAALAQSGSAAVSGPNPAGVPAIIVVFSDREAQALAAKIPGAIIADKIVDNIGEPGSKLLARLGQGLTRGF